MKSLILSILLVLIIIIGSTFIYSYMEKTAYKIHREIEAIEESIKDENWESAEVKFHEFKENWEPKSTLWMTLIGHEEIDNIEEALIKSEVFIYQRDESSSLENLVLLKYYLKHIYQKEKVTIYNIF